jgi:hypothetical protein
LIQKEQPARDDFNIAWTLNTMLGSGCGHLKAALAYPAALFYSEPRLTLVMMARAAASLIQSFDNIGVVDVRRNMDFARGLIVAAALKELAAGPQPAGPQLQLVIGMMLGVSVYLGG